MSNCKIDIVPEIKIVKNPIKKIIKEVDLIIINNSLKRSIKKIPAVTIVAECNSADTGVGPSIASGSYV